MSLGKAIASPHRNGERRRAPSATISFYFNDTTTTEIYTLSLHDALPIYRHLDLGAVGLADLDVVGGAVVARLGAGRSEEHTYELQSQSNVVCRLLLEKKKQQRSHDTHVS